LPESTGAEEHLFHVVDQLEVMRPDLLVVDAISACTRMGSEDIAFNFVARLIGISKRLGMSAIFTNQTTTLAPVQEISRLLKRRGVLAPLKRDGVGLRAA
jgi:circadian clock protein KaiC